MRWFAILSELGLIKVKQVIKCNQSNRKDGELGRTQQASMVLRILGIML